MKGFSAHKDTVVTFGPESVTFIVGNLNSGKSSIAQAIELAMTRECERYRKRTDDQRNFIHDLGGNDRFSVSLETDTGTATLARPRTGTASFTWDNGSRAISGDEGQAIMMDKLGARSAGILTAVMSTADLFDRDPKEQRELILGLVQPKVSWESVQQAYSDAGHDKDGLGLIPEVSSLGGMDIAYKAAFDERTAVNRSLKELRPPDIEEGTVRPNVKGIEERLASIEAERLALHRQLAEMEGARKNGPEVMRARLQEEMGELRAAADAAPASDAKAIAAAKKVADEAWKATQAAAKARNEAKDLLAELKAEETQLTKNVEQLRNFNGLCVAGPHACPAPKESMDAAFKAQEAKLVKVRSMHAEGLIKFGEFEKAALDPAKARNADGVLAKLQAEAENAKARAESIRKIEAQIAALPADSDTTENPAPGIRAKIQEFDGRIANGKELLAKAQRTIVQLEMVGKVAEQRKALEQKSVHLENLVAFFGPKGYRVDLIAKNISAFEATVNSALAQYGFEFTFNADPWQIMAKGRDVNRLSRSERFRLGIALQVGIARASKLDFVLVDNMEILTPEARTETLKLLAQAKIGQAILILSLMVPEEEFLKKRAAASPGGPAFFLVRNKGGVSEVERC